MRISRLAVNNFRNLASQEVSFNEGITLVMGKNAQGKTNLAESIFVASTTKSPRTNNFNDLVTDGKESASVSIDVERNFGSVNISYQIDSKGEKHFSVNGNQISKLGEVFGNLVVIYFCPSDLSIVSGSPQERRDYMDTDISQLSGSYYNLVQRYNKILMQRNKLLKFERNTEALKQQLAVWNEQLASVAAPIIKTRKGFIEKLKAPAHEAMKHISSEKDDLVLEYVGARGNTTEEIKAELKKSLEYNFERDLELGYTTIGPHRDDLYIGLNGKDARSFSSQGQQRSIVLALKFGEMEIFTKEMGEPPVLILDDVFSELDPSRQRKLYEKMSAYQAIITGTSFKFKPSSPYQKLEVKNGVCKLRATCRAIPDVK